MSVRRPKMQIKPKVSTRAMAAKAAAEVTTKKQVEATAKNIDVVVTADPQDVTGGPTDRITESSSSPLTTSFVVVADDEDNQRTESTNDTNVAENMSQSEKSIINLPVDEDYENQSKLKPNLEGETKTEKTLKTKGKASRKRKTLPSTDKSVMTMRELIGYNPPPTEDQKEVKAKSAELSDKQLPVEETVNKISFTDDNPEERAQETIVGPRVKVGADGQLILDEESVIVKRKRSNAVDGPALLESASTTSACTNYSSFRNKNKSTSKHRWTEHETIRFYSALNTIGTDFTLMANLFFRGKRTRLDLRNKFKKEEKINKMMIDEALFSPNTFINQCPELDELLADSSDSDDESQQKSVKPKAVKQKA